MMPLLFIQLGAVLGVAVLISLVMRALGQPLLVGYIISGVFVGPAFLGLVKHGDAIDAFGQLGVVFLLFMVGLGLRPQLIREVGKVALVTGLGQILFTTIFGYFIATALGFSWIVSLYLALAFTFSSTVVVMQLLYSMEEQEALYGRIVIGVLLVQDMMAMLVFLFLTTFNPEGSIGDTLVMIATKMSVVFLGIFFLMRFAVPRIEQYFARSREVVFLFALAICFLFAAGFSALGFSRELGALFAGVLLSLSPFHRDVALRLSPLRDFFLMMFFVVLGTQISWESFVLNWPMIFAFTVFILVGNPFIVLVLMRSAGYTLRTAFFAGLTVAQISEFSLVLLSAGAALGQLPAEIIGPATIIGLITIFISSYFITHNHRLFTALEPALRMIFGPDRTAENESNQKPVEVLLFGCHRLGTGIVDALEEMKVSFLVVDQDPDIIRVLHAAKVPHIFGSAEDPALLEALPIKHARTIITTVPDVEINRLLIKRIRESNAVAVILSIANHQDQAEELYEAGATYVIVPPYLGRRYLIDLLKEYGLNAEGYHDERQTHLRELLYLQEGTRQ